MSFHIILYKNKSEDNRVDKELISPINMVGVLREESTVIDPVILIQTENPTEYNYAYIAEYHRNYFIKEFTAVRNGLWRVAMHVDVLSTYKAEIRRLNAVIEKQQQEGNVFYNDGSYKAREDTFTEVKEFDNGFNDTGELILITAGEQAAT